MMTYLISTNGISVQYTNICTMKTQDANSNAISPFLNRMAVCMHTHVKAITWRITMQQEV